MDVYIGQEQRVERPRTRGFIKLFISLYVLTYLTSDKEGFPSIADVILLSLHILKRIAGLIELVAHLLSGLL